MSRIGTQPVALPSGVTVAINNGCVSVKGSKGELSMTLHPNVKATLNDNVVTVERINEEKISKSVHGLTRNLIVNMVEGVTKGFSKSLEITGVGYKAQIQGKKLILSLGFSHPIEFPFPNGITIESDAEKKNILYVKGIDKQLVGETAAKIRSYRKPEPYKGKGIKYTDERILRKAGKTAATAKA